MIKKFLICALFLLGFVLFETSILSNILYIKIMPDLVLLVTIYIAINNGKLFGVTSGFTGGLLLDFFSLAPFGLHALVRTIIGYIGGTFRKSINTSGILIPFVIGICVTLLKGITAFVVSILFPHVRAFDLFSLGFLVEILINAVLAPFTFRFLNVFNRLITVDIGKVL